MARVALCQDMLVEYAGYMSISAVLKEAGHTVEVFFDDQLHPDAFLDELASFAPDIVAFSLLTPTVPWAQKTARAVHERVGALTVAGNVHAIMNTAAVMDEGAMDLVCTGEGEYAMLELCERVDAGGDHTTIAGFWARTPDGIRQNPARELVDMNALPFMDRDMYDKYWFFRHSTYLRVCCGRGCPFRCSFCCNTNLTEHYGGRDYFRKRDPELAVAEIVHLLEKRPKVDYVFILDEVLWFDRAWLYEFLRLYQERVGLPFTANLKFNGVREEDIKRLAAAGAHGMAVNVESGSEEQRRGILNKPVSDAHIFQVADWLHQYGVHFGNSVFFGLPGDTFEDHIDRIPFFRRIGADYVWTTFLQPYPGLKILEDEALRASIPMGKEFEATFHHDMYLNVEDRDRLVNLKKVYFLMVRFPVLERPLRRLCQHRIPILFDVLFLAHFMWYAFQAEHVSFLQMLHHVKTLCVNPVLRRRQTLQSVGRPFGLSYRRTAERRLRTAERRARAAERKRRALEARIEADPGIGLRQEAPTPQTVAIGPVRRNPSVADPTDPATVAPIAPRS